MLSGQAAEWLASRREDLNARYARASRRHPRLSGDAVKAGLAAVLPALAGNEPGADALCSAVFDLILLHVARGALATQPGLEILLRESFPRLRPLLLTRPTTLPASLSNAVENLGARGGDLARGLGALAQVLPDADGLLDAGVVLAWRLGEARLRRAALDRAATLTPGAIAVALGLDGWPAAAVSLAVTALEHDAWHAPATRITAHTLATIADRTADLQALAGPLAAPPRPDAAAWRPVASLGDFAGLGGSFARPPLLLDGGDRHLLHVRSGDACFVVEADVYGSVCRPVADPGLPVRKPGREPLRTIARGLTPAEGARLTDPGVTSMAVFADAVAVTHADSYRIRVYVPAPGALA